MYSNELEIEITAADIDYAKTYKIYVDTNIFVLSTNNIKEIKKMLDQATMIVNIQKGRPLREDAKDVLTKQKQQEIWEHEGQWITGDKRIAYKDFLTGAIGMIPEKSLLVGGLPFFRRAATEPSILPYLMINTQSCPLPAEGGIILPDSETLSDCIRISPFLGQNQRRDFIGLKSISLMNSKGTPLGEYTMI